jgi:RND family efflux transporter MFP subunit
MESRFELPTRRSDCKFGSRFLRERKLLRLGSAVLGVLLIVGCEKKEAAPPPMPPEVEITEVVEQNVPIYQEWVAQLNGQNNADITPKVQGYVLSQAYKDGYYVTKGQLLYVLDDRPFVAALDQAKAQVAVAQANLDEATNNVERDTPLAAQHAIPQKQLDTDQSVQAAGRAQVDAAKAQMANAQLNLAWTKVYSPINGIAGTTNSYVGDLVGVTTKMTTVSTVDPIRANFNISESEYLATSQRISNLIRGGTRQIVQWPITYIQANGVPFPEKGKIVLVNRQVTSETGTIQVAAEFPNKGGILRPGGFGRVRIEIGTNKDALLVPQAAVIEVQSMYQLVVITPENKAAFRPVKVGDRVGTNWIITDGVKLGEKVVVQGFMKLREGIPVSAKPYVAAAAPGSN